MDNQSDIPQKALELLDGDLAEGETILWTGRPAPYYFNHDVWVFFLNGVFWTLLDIAGIVLYILGIVGQNEDFFTRLLSCSYLLLILPLTLGACYSPIWNYRKLKRTAYAITNRRAIILTPKLFYMGLTRKAYPIHPDMICERRIRSNGSGDLIFDYDEVLQRCGFGKRSRRRLGFVRLRNVKEVEAILREQMEETAKAAPKK